jgi:hypothetical protein
LPNTRLHYYNVVQDQSGNAVQGASVYLYDVGTTNPIGQIIYTTAAGVGTYTNPLTTNANGEVDFWLESGARIDIFIQGTTAIGNSFEKTITVDLNDGYTGTVTFARVLLNTNNPAENDPSGSPEISSDGLDLEIKAAWAGDVGGVVRVKPHNHNAKAMVEFLEGGTLRQYNAAGTTYADIEAPAQDQTRLSIEHGSGAPNGADGRPVGTLYFQTGATPRLYVKDTSSTYKSVILS